MQTLFVAMGLLGFIALIVVLLMLVHKRDQKAEAAKNANTP